jgi:hypothetical protein
MARDSLQMSGDRARLLRRALEISIAARTNQGKTSNRLEWQQLPETKRGRDPNRIRHPRPTPEIPLTPAQKLAELTAKVTQSLVHQQKAINLMQETSKGIAGLSEHR